MALRQLLRKQFSTMTSLPGNLRHMMAIPPVRTFPPLPKGSIKSANHIIGNLYINKGWNNPVYIHESDPRAVLIRLDLPGSDRSTLNFRHRENLNRIDFQASENPTKMHGIYPKGGPARTYNGSIILDPFRFRVKDYTVELVNGVLWVQVRSGPAYNLFVTQGVDRFCLIGYREDALVWSVDMPGLCDSDQTLTVEGNMISFDGKESQLPPFETDSEKLMRVFQGCFEVDPKTYNAKAVKAELENGVLWIEVPRHHKLPPGSEDPDPGEWTRLHCGPIQWQLENMQSANDQVIVSFGDKN